MAKNHYKTRIHARKRASKHYRRLKITNLDKHALQPRIEGPTKKTANLKK